MILENEAAAEAALTHLTTLLEQNETVQSFHALKARVEANDHLKELEEQIKEAQKQAAQFAHYDKPQAQQEALKEADRLTKEFNEHPLVVAYREQLAETNDLLQHLTMMIQQTVNEAMEEDNEK